MSTLYSSFVDYQRVKRFLISWFVISCVTILCHVNFFNARSLPLPFLASSEIIGNRSLYSRDLIADDKKPKANDDEVTTLEENPIQFNILQNDENKENQGGGKDDDDDDDDDDGDDEIDANTVDLNPETDVIDRTLGTSAGSYAVNNEGEVTFIPAANFFGKSKIDYTVQNTEGEESNPAHITVNVTNVNDVPVITGQAPKPLTTREGVPIEIKLSDVIVSDPDDNFPQGFSIALDDGENYSVAGTLVTPDKNYAGPLLVPVTVNDGLASSLPFVLNLTVTSDNDAPVITGQSPNPISATEEQPFTIELTNLTVTDPDDTYPNDFTLQISNGTNYTVAGNTVTPSPNFYGTLSIPVIVNDGEEDSNTFNVQVNVANVNDAPQITAQTPNPLTTTEDTPITVEFNNLTVTDSDNTYPSGFSMTLTDGDNYDVNGRVVTPSTNFIGTLTVPVVVNDGQANSNVFSLSISVTGSNDVPVITGQSPLSVDEDNSITVTLAHLTVVDEDNSYPTGFSLSLGGGSNYTLSGTTVIPSPNFAGTLSVPVTVNDGQASSNPFTLSITVNAVNDAPVITGQTTLTTNENTAITLTTGNFSVTDVDNVYPNGFTVIVQPGTNYSANGSTVTPAPGFNGVLSVGVQVNDGTSNSDLFDASINVTAVNDAPVITGSETLTVAEDNSITPTLANLTVTDSDSDYPTGFTLTVLSGTNYTVSNGAVVPAPNFNGSLSVNVLVNDGTSNSNVFPVPINVTAVNDAPLITAQQALSIGEDQSITLALSQLTVVDVDNAYPTGFTLTAFPGNDYTLNGLTVTPTLDFRGTLTVPVQVSDGALTSNIFDLQIAVTDINDAPIITGQTPVSTTEDTPVAISLGNLVVFDPDNTFPNGFTMAIAPGNNYTVVGNVITPALDFNGTLNVQVTVNDGTSTSAPFTFQIQVGDANDPPTITGQTPLTTNEETPLTISLANFTVTDPDNVYPNGFSLEVSAGENYTVQGTTITPASNFYGTLTVPVRVNDGVNYSPTYNSTVQVNPVNDAPFFDAINNQNIQENGTPSVITITGVSKGAGEGDQTLTFSAVSNNTAVIPNPTVSYAGATTAQLTYTLMPNTSGLVTITVTATDNGSSVSPNQNTYSSTFQINVAEVNNAPTLDNIANVTIQEDAPSQNIALSGITAGAGESQTISIEVTTDKPSLFETFSLVYNSPQSTGTLQIKPSANSHGVANVTVKVSDNGSNISPSVNSISKTFTITIQPVNDPPIFTSTPLTVAAIGEQYEYVISFTDVETPDLALTVNNKPSWATLTKLSAGKYRLSGVPPASAQGETTIELRINDNDQSASQPFKLVVNNRPVSKPVQISIQEDQSYTFTTGIFSAAYTDVDQHPLTAILFPQLPANGKLILGGVDVKANDTIQVARIGELQYKPTLNYDKPDNFFWKAFDGYHFSAVQASIDVAIAPVNDPPTITLAQDTLVFDVTGVPAIVSSVFDITDPDNDSLTRAEIVFTANFEPQFDLLILQQTANVRGFYEPEFGRIILTGLAPIEEYKEVMARIQYNYLNTIDPLLRLKRLTYTASDGIATSEPVDRFIDLEYTFIDLEIPSGFTPNGDSANDLWVITRPGGLEQLQDASIRIVNRRGVVVFEGKGFARPWDGTMNGSPLPADSYFFTIDLNLRSKKTYKGVVTILR